MVEDRLRNRQGDNPEDPVLMRKPAPSLARLTDGGKATSAHGKLKKAEWDDALPPMLVISEASLAKDAQPEKSRVDGSGAKTPRTYLTFALSDQERCANR